MTPIAWTLVADGGSDRALLPVLRWSLREMRPSWTLLEPGFQVRRSSAPFRDELERAVRDTRPDLLFVHRDAERVPRLQRLEEIPVLSSSQVRVVPVRMTEAWLLIDEKAIRHAASNPNGSAALNLPRSRDLEALADPKEELRERILLPSGLAGRRREKLRRDLPGRCQLVAQNIEDFGALREVEAFRAFLVELGAAVSSFEA